MDENTVWALILSLLVMVGAFFVNIKFIKPRQDAARQQQQIELAQKEAEQKKKVEENTERACSEFGAIHCVFPAGNAVVAAVEVKEIVEAQWRDLGMPETLWHCHVEEFGPLIVSIDSYGKNYFEEKKVEYNIKKDEQIELISKQVGFIK